MPRSGRSRRRACSCRSAMPVGRRPYSAAASRGLEQVRIAAAHSPAAPCWTGPGPSPGHAQRDALSAGARRSETAARPEQLPTLGSRTAASAATSALPRGVERWTAPRAAAAASIGGSARRAGREARARRSRSRRPAPRRRRLPVRPVSPETQRRQRLGSLPGQHVRSSAPQVGRSRGIQDRRHLAVGPARSSSGSSPRRGRVVKAAGDAGQPERDDDCGAERAYGR